MIIHFFDDGESEWETIGYTRKTYKKARWRKKARRTIKQIRINDPVFKGVLYV